MDDLIADFLIEANESLETVDAELVKFESRPDDRAALDKIFRLVHTLKGTAGFLALGRLEAVAHAGETLLGRFRDGKLEVTSGAVTLVLSSIDRIKTIIEGLASAGVEPVGDDTALISALEAISNAAPAALGAPAVARGQPTVPEAVVHVPLPVAPLAQTDPQVQGPRPGEVSEAELEAAFLAAEGPRFDDAPLEESRSLSPPVKIAAEVHAEEGFNPPGPQSIRVGVNVIEDLMTLVSELVLTRNQLLQVNRGRDDEAFFPPLQRLSTITGELQDSVMKTRMQPIGVAWKKLPRIVRDLSNELSKKIELELEGETTELDRQVLELIRDPLTHMVRNSADHGLETPAERIAAGKSDTGVIRLSAFHEGGAIVIRLRDDGRGLDTQRIREKAIEKGLIGRADAEVMSEAQIHRLILAPGFSTARKVTNLSGRGVGMDVVRTNVEQIGGQIELYSVSGGGSTITIKIPLTLAIVSALIVGAGGARFAVPQGAVLELIKIGGGNPEHRVEAIEQVRMVRLREHMVPLIDLAAEFGQADREPPAFVIIMQVGSHRFGVMVDEVVDTEEIVVKPLAAILRNISVFSGATILGDGSVVLIVDPNGLTQKAAEMSASNMRSVSETDDEAAWMTDEKTSLLIVRVGDGAPKAVELSRITRLEHARAEHIEHYAGRSSLEYRGKLMPILRVEEDQTLRTKGIQPLLVFAGPQYVMGLAVDEIIDVVNVLFKIELNPTRTGVVGVGNVAGKATEILDVDYYVLRALSEVSSREVSTRGNIKTKAAA